MSQLNSIPFIHLLKENIVFPLPEKKSFDIQLLSTNKKNQRRLSQFFVFTKFVKYSLETCLDMYIDWTTITVNPREIRQSLGIYHFNNPVSLLMRFE